MYTPNNLQIYLAASTGAMAGMAASYRIPTDPSPSTYAGQAVIADAFAQALDTLIPPSPTQLPPDSVSLLNALSYAVWQDRSPIVDASSILPATYASVAAAIAAIGTAQNAQFGSQGIDPGSIYSWTDTGEWSPPFVCWPHTNAILVGTSTGIIVPFGTPVSTTPADYQINITTGGIEGTAIFELTSSIAPTISGITVPAGAGLYVVAGTGITLQFSAGTYDLADAWNWSTVFADIGNGSLVGNYRVVGDSMDLRIVFTMGATTDLGGGIGSPTSLGIILPTPPATMVDANKLPVVTTFASFYTLKAIAVIATTGGGTIAFPLTVVQTSAFTMTNVATSLLSTLAPGEYAAIQMAAVPLTSVQ